MGIFQFFKPKHRRVKFLISLPNRSEFHKDKKTVEEFLRRIQSSGATVVSDISKKSLSDISGYDVVIIVAHHDIDRDGLETRMGLINTSTLITLLPKDFHGIVDLSCCYSDTLMNSIKEHCPDCHVQATSIQTTLLFRLSIYPTVIKSFVSDNKREYHDIYKTVFDHALSLIRKRGLSDSSHDDTVKLGAYASSVFSPSVVKRNVPFMVQFFLHKDTESDNVLLMAKRMDPSTGFVDTQQLPIRLKMRDRIAIEVSIISPENNLIKIDNPVKEIVWGNFTTKLQFALTVDSNFKADSFLVDSKIEVNRVPVGVCMFRVSVEDKINEVPAHVDLIPYNREKEHDNIVANTKEKLLGQMEKLQRRISECNDLSDLQQLNNDLTVCKGCIELFDNTHNIPPKVIKRAFISSTSDLGVFRDVMRKEVEAYGLYPEMYENWQQTIGSPRDVCCQKVLSSDLYIAVFGERYGFIEPAWDMSMTEIEYRTALSAGKPILVFVLELPDERQMEVRQSIFVESVRSSRILKYFNDINTLSLLLQRDLSKINCL